MAYTWKPMNLKLWVLIVLLLGCSSKVDNPYARDALRHASISLLKYGDRLRLNQEYPAAKQAYLKAYHKALSRYDQALIELVQMRMFSLHLMLSEFESAQGLLSMWQQTTTNSQAVLSAQARLLWHQGQNEQAAQGFKRLYLSDSSSEEQKVYFRFWYLRTLSRPLTEPEWRTLEQDLEFLQQQKREAELKNIEVFYFAREQAYLLALKHTHKKSLIWLQALLALAGELELSAKVLWCLGQLTEWHQGQGNTEEADKYREQYLALKSHLQG